MFWYLWTVFHTCGVWREITEKREQRSSTNLFWVNLQCAQQDDGESCGYYIMSFMNDLVLCAKGKVKLTEVLRHKNSQALTKAQIDELRDKFVIFILDNLMMFKMYWVSFLSS